MSDYPRGRFCWYDLMTPDPSAAEGFYKEVAGWGTDIWQGSEIPYTMFTNGGKPLGGVMPLPEQARAQGAPPNWMAYIAVPDVHETTAKAQSLGGHVYVEPQEIPNVGSFAVLADPQGAVFAVFTPKEEMPGQDEPPGKGEFSWHELATTDHVAAFDFYADLFGWQKTDAMDMGDMGVYQMYGAGNSTLGGMFNKPAEMPAPPHWLYYIRVDDVRTAVEKVKALGGQVFNGPMEVPGGDMIAQCMDPQGAAFALHSPAGGS
jgi:predicted enzyme related to lactoylglutathione lyase